MTEYDLELEDIYNQIVYYPNKIYEIFCDFFGEEHVDLQNVYDKENFYGILKTACKNVEEVRLNKEACIRDYKNLSSYPYILVWFPKLKITNEYDESVEVEDFWAKVEITYTGKMRYGFKLNRSTYFKSHILADYQHSHVNGIDRSLNFSSCCLGIGPIKNTQNSLNMDYDESLWQLFCFELNKYVQTESIAGVPYRKMSKIKDKEYSNKINSFRYIDNYDFAYSDNLKEIIFLFTKHFLDKRKLKFNYFNNSYGLGMSFLEYMLTISNCFIEWYNEELRQGNVNISPNDLYCKNILQKVSITNNSIYTIANNYNTSSLLSKIGTKMFTFKGKDIVLNIVEDQEIENYSTILNIDIATAILNSVLKTINVNYE